MVNSFAVIVDMSRVFITGAAGSIGSELYRQLLDGNTILALDIDETRLFDMHEEYQQKGYDVDYRIADIRDKQLMRDIIGDFRPDIIFHAAALKHVTPHEIDPTGAVYTNVMGTLNVVETAKRYGVPKLIFISTDKVINQHCVMGTTKRLGELIVSNAGYVAVRFGNVLGSRGSVYEIWKRQIANGEPITITDWNMERYLMTIPQACELVREAAEVGEAGDILVLDMGKRVTLRDIFDKLLKEHNLETYATKIIGSRKGEAIKEGLFFPEEKTNKKGKFYIVKGAGD